MSTALAAVATAVAAAFALSTLERWSVRRRRHDLAWTTSLAAFALGGGCLVMGSADGWDPATFRLFYLFGAVLNVPLLAVGTTYLLRGRQAGDRAAVVVGLAGAFAAGVVLSAPLRAAVPADRLPRGSEVFGPLPRALAAVASGAGAAVVLAGACFSAWRGQLVVANLLIAAGTVVLSASGLLNSVLGEMEAFAVTLAVGVTLLFAGFLAAAARPNRRA